ncbi:MAG: nitroreductase family protein [Chlamydiae bacterium]|nr:nitroreductase family protein [Chlamydiota bacterium]
MDTIEAIFSRRSVRKFSCQPIPSELITLIINAAMHAPSAYNEQPWQFIIINDKNLLEKVPPFSPHAVMCTCATVGILICADKNFEKIPEMSPIDCAAATQNLLLAAHAKGLGAVWTGAFPDKKIMEGFKKLLNLPNSIIPFSFIILGYPVEPLVREDRFKIDRIHFNAW